MIHPASARQRLLSFSSPGETPAGPNLIAANDLPNHQITSILCQKVMP
jgi:hypothetical protein